MTNAGGAVAYVGRLPRCGNTSSATAASGETSKRYYGRRWERRLAGKRADAATCRALSWLPEKSATQRWWTSWRLQKSGRSLPNEWRYGGGAEANSGARRRQWWGFISVPFVSFVSFLFLWLCSVHFCFHSIFQLSYKSTRIKGSGGGAPPSSQLGRRQGGNLVLSYSN